LIFWRDYKTIKSNIITFKLSFYIPFSSPMVVNDSANETSDAQQQVKISNL